MTDVVLYATADRIATITLNRPEARNAMSREVLRRLPELVSRADEDDQVDVVIITGADPAFCAGLDLRQLGDGALTAQATPTTEERRSPPTHRGPLPPISKPIIGAINGAAITGGLELALACDFLVASERARFGDTHSRVGVMPGWGLTVLLSQAIGVRRAREMSFTGNFMTADEAWRVGLVNHVVPHAELLPTARRIAADVVGNHQPGVRELRRVYAGVTDDLEAWAFEDAASKEWARTRFDRHHVASQRESIIDRGRRQDHGPAESGSASETSTAEPQQGEP